MKYLKFSFEMVNSNSQRISKNIIERIRIVAGSVFIRVFVISIVSASALIFIASEYKSSERTVFTYNFDNILGTSFQLKVKAFSDKIAEKAKQMALSEIDRLSEK